MLAVKQIADVKFPTRWAEFWLLAFTSNPAGRSDALRAETALVLILGDIDRKPPLVRIHSQCITGEVFHSLRCDCQDQLHLAMRTMVDAGSGALIYELQEGRGIGLLEKLRAYELQDRGHDTVDANLELGHPVDARDYALPVAILRFLGCRELSLMTNNPDKIAAVRKAGINVLERVSAEVPFNVHSAEYMETKRRRLGHLSSLDDSSSLDNFSGLAEVCLAKSCVPATAPSDVQRVPAEKSSLAASQRTARG